MPHLSDLQDKYPQATFIGVVVNEPDRETVKTFVAEMGDQIRYRIAIEEPLAGRSGREGGSMTKHWLEASYQRGIPAAFIVNPAGKIAWIGHPIELEEPLAAVIDDRWDFDVKARAYRELLVETHARQKFRLQQEIKRARAADKDANISAILDEAIAADPLLEKEFGAQKLDELLKVQASKPAAMKYAAYLIDSVCREDAQALLLLSVVLFKPEGAPTPGNGLAPDADFARLAVKAMNSIRILTPPGPIGNTDDAACKDAI